MELEKRLLEASEIVPGDIWFSCDGAGIQVKIESVDVERATVYYSWEEDNRTVHHDKSSFAFQCRYYKPDYSELESTDRVVCQHFHDYRNCLECEEEQKQQIRTMMILAKKGVSADMEFICNDCNEKIHGGRVLDGEYIYIIERNTAEPAKSKFRCECCQDDIDDRDRD